MDWPILGILATFVVGWLGFFLQQRIRFQDVRKSLTAIAVDVSAIKDSQDIKKSLSLSKDVSRLRNMIENLRNDISRLTDTVTNETQVQQKNLLERVQKEQHRHIIESQRLLTEALRTSLESVVKSGDARERLITNLLGTIQATADNMVKAQSKILEKEGAQLIAEMKRSVDRSSASLLVDVKDISDRVETLPSLPAHVDSGGRRS